jgi:hypothetical protein
MKIFSYLFLVASLLLSPLLMADQETSNASELKTASSRSEENPVGDILKVITEKNDKQLITLHLDQKLFVCIDFPEDYYKKHALTYKTTDSLLLKKEAADFIDGFTPGFSQAYYFRFKPLALGETKLTIYQDPFFGKDIRYAEFVIKVVE